MQHQDAYVTIIREANHRWNAEDPTNPRLPHDSLLIVMGALIEMVQRNNGGGRRGWRDRAKPIILPAGTFGIGALVVDLIKAIT